jgi:hypothetical protein
VQTDDWAAGCAASFKRNGNAIHVYTIRALQLRRAISHPEACEIERKTLQRDLDAQNTRAYTSYTKWN